MNEQHVQAIRDFNRFYTNVIGLVDDHILNSDYSLPEARVLYELYHRQPCTAVSIMSSLKIDKGYLSRVLKSFERKKLIAKRTSNSDGRVTELSLTPRGSQAFKQINVASGQQIRTLFSSLTPRQLNEVIQHMNAVKRILNQPRL